ncbi:MAG: anthranilate synthase component I family protein [Chitinophagaceae bacterium]|nr:MAG: anthranilate synthase component I family protein [Chitinophagaceae bacterium]
MLNWLRPFSIFCYLDNQQYQIAPHQTDCLVAAGAHAFFEGADIKLADGFLGDAKEWVFGHLSYELKNSLYHFASNKEDKIGFPLYYFFRPQVVLEIKNNNLVIYAENPGKILEEINTSNVNASIFQLNSIDPKPVLTKDEYIEKIEALREHIHRGDCYEINFCQKFFAEDASIDPFVCFENLMQVSPNPFSAFYRLHQKYLLCASPERFLAKNGSKVFSQPIKGTVKRNLSSNESDEKLKRDLLNSQKEQSENVMVVDLVRNDLTKICKEATVKVDELFGIYSFPQVHQMISTISGELKEHILFSEIIDATFPMGSMTGAPKHRVMQLIDQYEPSARGIFSGAVGYFNPAGDFDFNVVIRSIMYNAANQYLSYQVGSGITFYSEAEKEWEECMLKAEAIKKVLTSQPALSS